MSFLIRSLRSLRRDGGETEQFTYVYVGDMEPATLPHESRWRTAENHWQMTNAEFSQCAEILPDGITGDKARTRVEQAAILFLYVYALDQACWACELES